MKLKVHHPFFANHSQHGGWRASAVEIPPGCLLRKDRYPQCTSSCLSVESFCPTLTPENSFQKQPHVGWLAVMESGHEFLQDS